MFARCVFPYAGHSGGAQHETPDSSAQRPVSMSVSPAVQVMMIGVVTCTPPEVRTVPLALPRVTMKAARMRHRPTTRQILVVIWSTLSNQKGRTNNHVQRSRSAERGMILVS